MEEKPARKDTSIAIIVIVAGLLTGAVLTYAFLKPEEQPRYSPEYRVAEGQRVPMGSAEAGAESPEDQSTTPAETPDETAGSAEEPAAGQDRTGGETVSPSEPPNSAADSVPSDESTASERKTIAEARERMTTRGVNEYAELTEELYIRVSAKMVIMASVLSQDADENTDPTEVQALLADNAAEVLADARVDPEEFWAYTRDVHSDPERAKEMGEKILREAEKHTQRKITVEDVPGMSPTPVPGADGE